MGQRVQTFCDPHVGEDDHGAESYELVLRKWDGSRWVDLIPPDRSVGDACGPSLDTMTVAQAVEVWKLRGRPKPGAAAATDDKPYPCEVPGCDRSYGHKSSRRKHMKDDHGWTLTDQRKRAPKPVVVVEPDSRSDRPEMRDQVAAVKPANGVPLTANGKPDGRKVPRDCDQPGCDRVGDKAPQSPQGWGAHRRHAHGITGPSESATAHRQRVAS